MVKGASAIVYLLLAFGIGASFAQTANNSIRTFEELINHLSETTDYQFSYHNSLDKTPLNVPADIDPANIGAIRAFLDAAGITVIVKGQRLIFKRSTVSRPKTISGYVRDAESGESLVGANVYDPVGKRGSATNTFGFFSLITEATFVNISFIGYRQQVLEVGAVGSDLEILLEKENTALKEVVISGYQAGHETAEMSAIKISPEVVKKLPVFMGESDILKAMQLLPGVQSGTEGTAGLYVRGGGPDQNLILLDGVPVYNANHVFGFFSIFNTDAIRNFELIKGGFPARYGGRLSSIIDVQMKEGNLNKLEGEGAIGVVASKFTVSGPISTGKTSFMLSGRRTYLDALAVPIQKASDSRRVVGANFWDLNAKINHLFSPRNRIYLSFYAGNDKLYDNHHYNNGIDIDEKENAQIKWGNITSAFRWNHTYTDKLFGNITVTFSKYQFDLDRTINYKYADYVRSPDVFRQNEYYSNITDVGAKIDFDYAAGENHYLRFGGNYIDHVLNPGVSRFRSHIKTDTTFGSRRAGLREAYLYVEDEISVTTTTRANIGVHGSLAFTDGKSYSSIQPRVTINQKLLPKLSLKVSYSKMAQYIHLLVNSGVGLPTDLWVPSTKLVKPQLSDQVAIGIAATHKMLEISVESYYKWMANLIEYKDGAGFLDIDSKWERKLEFGSGTSYGVEFLVQKRTGRYTGWIGYTWSKAMRDFDNLNFGNPFPYRYDRPHNLSVVFNHQVRNNIEVGAVWVYNTGNAVTLPTASYPRGAWSSNNAVYEDYIKHYPGRNSSRTKDYHRLDLSISFKKAKKWGERKWVVGIYNAYSRLNPTFIEFDDTNEQAKKFVQFSLFPIIPNVSYQFKF